MTAAIIAVGVLLAVIIVVCLVCVIIYLAGGS